MKYRHNKEESAEYLRRALPLMANQNASLHPVSYTVWYEYVSGGSNTAGSNTALIDAVDALIAQHRTLNERDTLRLFEHFVADIDGETANTVAAGFQRILGEVSQSTGVAAQQADVFGETLQRLTRESDAQNGPFDIDAVLAGIQAMQAAVATLKTRLDSSQQEIDGLRKEVARARDAAPTDGLTGLVNRRGFDQALADCLANAGSTEGPCLLMGDIDHFKQINDSYGHLLGDKVIRAVATVVKDKVKGRDTAARYSGEEFVVLLPDTSLHGAQMLAEQIRGAIERGRIRRSGSDEAMARVTLSLGVARYQPGEPHTAFIERADRALYASKQNGRSRLSVAAA